MADDREAGRVMVGHAQKPVRAAAKHFACQRTGETEQNQRLFFTAPAS
ncbi:MAG: hypothetical protein WA096_02605 [Smithella sp.]